jgi:hypothetical protein
LHLRIDDLAADLDQASVLDAAWTRGLAIEAGEAAVQVLLSAAGDRRALEHLLDQVDATARPVQFVAEQLVGGTGGVAEAAMHALADDVLRRPAVGRAAKLRTEMGFHRLTVPRTNVPG